jgi:DNA-binding MarR family transcriptional regulator
VQDRTDHDPLQLHDIVDAASVVHVTVERLFRLLKAQMAAALTGQGSSIVEWRILLMLRIHGEMAQKHLVHEVAMPQAQVSRALAAMRRRGLIAARRSASDGRVMLFRLTPAGTDLHAAIAPTMAWRKRTLDGALPPAELDAFMASAGRIARAISADAYDRQPPA